MAGCGENWPEVRGDARPDRAVAHGSLGHRQRGP